MRVPKTLSTVESRGATGAGMVLARHTVTAISPTRMGPSRMANARLLAIMRPSILSLPPGNPHNLTRRALADPSAGCRSLRCVYAGVGRLFFTRSSTRMPASLSMLMSASMLNSSISPRNSSSSRDCGTPSRLAARDLPSPRATVRISDMSRERSNKFSASTYGNPKSANRFPVRATAAAVRLLIVGLRCVIPCCLSFCRNSERGATDSSLLRLKGPVANVADTNLARSGCVDRGPQTQEITGNIVVIAGDLELVGELGPGPAIDAVMHRHNVPIVFDSDPQLTADTGGFCTATLQAVAVHDQTV